MKIKQITIPFNTNDIDEIKLQPGVWFLIGTQDNADNAIVCLQTGESSDIGNEIASDSTLLSTEAPEPNQKDYINYFGEKQFSYIDYPGWQAVELYHHIAITYSGLSFICLYGQAMESEDVRKRIEKYIAFRTKCKYWRDSRPFDSEKPKEFVLERKEYCDKQLPELSEAIGKDIVTIIEELLRGKVLIL